MDGFGDNFTDPPEVDPAAEFLAREQDELAGLEVEIPPANAAPAAMPVQNGKQSFLTYFSEKLYMHIKIIYLHKKLYINTHPCLILHKNSCHFSSKFL